MIEPMYDSPQAMASTALSRLPAQRREVRGRRPPAELTGLRVEPMAALAWSEAVVPAEGIAASSPAGARRSWIHRAPQRQVLTLYRSASMGGRDIPAPWWLLALHRGDLLRREAGFAIEDGIHALLSERPGWVYMPWVGDGEDGYWEFAPSDVTTEPGRPTTVMLTSDHLGWISLLPAHRSSMGDEPEPIALAGEQVLREHLDQIERW